MGLFTCRYWHTRRRGIPRPSQPDSTGLCGLTWWVITDYIATVACTPIWVQVSSTTMRLMLSAVLIVLAVSRVSHGIFFDTPVSLFDIWILWPLFIIFFNRGHPAQVIVSVAHSAERSVWALSFSCVSGKPETTQCQDCVSRDLTPSVTLEVSD